MIILSQQEYDKLMAKASHYTDKEGLKQSFRAYLRVKLNHTKTSTWEQLYKALQEAIKDF